MNVKIANTIVFSGIGVFLSGCAAVPIAALALSGTSIYNQLNPEKNVDIAIDDAGSVRMRTQLKNVNHLAILAKDTSSLAFSDVWEKSGKQASIITNKGDPSVISLSQAKGVLSSACKPGTDASAYGRSGDTNVNRLGILIGKADATVNLDLYIYNCRTKKLDSSPVIISFNAMGVDATQIDRSIGAGIAAKLLEISK